MVSIRFAGLVSTMALFSSTSALVNTVAPTPASGVSIPGPTPSLFGCYGSSQGMTWTGNFNYMTIAICQIYCLNNDKPVAATSAGTDCYCGDYAPPLAAVLSDTKCTANCTGFGTQMCGGSNSTNGGVILSVYNDQLESAINNSPDSLTSSTSSMSSTKTAAATGVASSTVPAIVTVTNAGGAIVTVVASESASASASGKGSNTAGIVAGVVIGVIVIAAVAGGVWFFMRRKQRREVEEEHKRQVAVNSFIAGSKPENGSAPDVRLDPAILRDRRMSDGSIMDNQDYSRRILKVTNA